MQTAVDWIARWTTLGGILPLVVSCGIGTPTVPAGMEQVRESLSRFEDPAVAWREGYHAEGDFVVGANGGVGIHFVRADQVVLDPDRPQRLVYNLRPDGTFELGAAEWDVNVNKDASPPTMFDRRLDGPLSSHIGGDTVEYRLHAWLFVHNPDGLFAESNPTIAQPAFWPEVRKSQSQLALLGDVDAAGAAGYVFQGECALPGDTSNLVLLFQDDTAPALQTYRPQALLFAQLDGQPVLVGAQWRVPLADVSARPTLFGQKFGGPYDSLQRDGERYFALTLWPYLDNPQGLFTPAVALRCGQPSYDQ